MANTLFDTPDDLLTRTMPSDFLDPHEDILDCSDEEIKTIGNALMTTGLGIEGTVDMMRGTLGALMQEPKRFRQFIDRLHKIDGHFFFNV